MTYNDWWLILTGYFSHLGFFFFLKKMDCHSTFEESILIFHMKKNLGWIWPLINSFQKKCTINCWAHKFVFDVEKIQNSGFFSNLEKKKKKWLSDRLTKNFFKKTKLNSNDGVMIETKSIKWLKKMKILGKLI